MPRILIGLSVSSGLEAVDAVAIRAEGIGLDLAPTVVSVTRTPFPPSLRDAVRAGAASAPAQGLARALAETAVHAARHALSQAGINPRDAFIIGLLDPVRPAAELGDVWREVADRVAEQTGISVVHGFRQRDRAAGGSGVPITAAADYLLFRSPDRTNLLIHLGSVASLVLVPRSGRISGVLGFDAGPGNQLFNELIFHGTRAKELSDLGGKKAVQGRCLDPLLKRWLEHPHLGRIPPKSIHPEAFGRSFLLAAFEQAREQNAGLPDLLCTATHFAARAIGDAVKKWAPVKEPCRILATGGGVRNGFLWQLVSQSIPAGIVRSDAAGLAALARNAAAAALLAALAADGVAGNLAALTGALGERLLGHFAPGESRNWSRVAAWAADQSGEYPRANRAA